jgi:hypothetical protein
MNRTILVGGLAAIVFSFAVIGGCGTDEDRIPSCPPCPTTAEPVDVLFMSAEVEPSRIDSMIDYSARHHLFPEGSCLQALSLTDSVPPLDVLERFDAILVYTVDFLDYPQQNDSLGNVLADYVDGGGGLVMCQYSMYFGGAGITGRIRAAGYCPFLAEGPLDEIHTDRTIDVDSVDFPLHPIFDGIDLREVRFIWLHFNLHPELDATATLLARDQFGANVVAVNERGNIVALNAWPPFLFTDVQPGYAESAKLIANSLLYVAGAEAPLR